MEARNVSENMQTLERDLMKIIESAIDDFLNNQSNISLPIDDRHQAVISAAVNTLVGAIINLVPGTDNKLQYFEDIYKAARNHIQMISMSQEAIDATKN